jgi:hypothetical protein
VSEGAISRPSLFFKKPNRRRKKRQRILDLIDSSATGITRKELAAAVDSHTNCVSVMIHQINKELIEQGWKITSTGPVEQHQKRRGAPQRRYRLVRLYAAITGFHHFDRPR